MSIITAIANDGNLKTKAAIGYDLKLGEICEQHLADYLTANGLTAYRACQRFVQSDHLTSRREQWQYAIDELEYDLLSCQLRCDGKDHLDKQLLKPSFRHHPSYKVLDGDPYLDYSLLRRH